MLAKNQIFNPFEYKVFFIMENQNPLLHLKKVAVVCSDTISDGLMMMVASHRLHAEGIIVVTFHDRLRELQDWFQNHTIFFKPPLSQIESTFEDFDLVIVQNDTTPYTRSIIHHLKKGRHPQLSIFYPLYSKYRHGALSLWDRVFNKHLPMVDNISFAISSLLHSRDHSKNNGLMPPSQLLHRRYRKRVAILFSSSLSKKYEKIGNEVKKLGFEPLFISEENIMRGASLIYESGFFIGPNSDLCHLASNLQIPTLVILGSKRPTGLWKPGWLRSSFIHLPRWIPRALEHFVLPSRVVSGFKKLVERS